MIDVARGPYSRFNARRSTPEQVAKDFVPPHCYWRLTDTVDPQLLIGPRGIGKTTLLKMLLPEAIDAWEQEDPNARAARERIRFTGVFVAADKMWAGQVDQLGASIPVEHRARFGAAAFAYMSLEAFADSALYRTSGDYERFKAVQMSGEQEERLVRRVGPYWRAHPASATLADLADDAHDNLARIGQLMQEAAVPGLSSTELDAIRKDKVLSVDFFSAATRFLDAFNRAAGERYEPWVLLIDEFEFLPPWTRVQLGSGFQGRDTRLSFKLSIAPYTGIEPFAGTPLNDWERVSLVPESREQEDDFTHELLARQLGGASAEEVLGRGGFEPREGDSYGPRSQNARDVRALAKTDSGFRKWMASRQAGPTSAKSMKEQRNYDSFRKVMPLVRLKLEYNKPGPHEESTGRSRHRVPEIYSGAENVYAMTEGNPRWVKALAFALLAERDSGSTIKPDQQARAIARVSWELYNNLKAVPIERRTTEPPVPGTDTVNAPLTEYADLTPFTLVTTLGNYLEERVQGPNFTADPPGTFVLDDEDPWLADVLNSLIFLGAMTVESGDSQNGRDGVRLAHMWAPIFRILPRKGKPRSLRQSLKHIRQSPRRRGVSPDQISMELD